MQWARKATGSAVVITNPAGEVLLVRRAYPPGDWVLPGGNAEARESPVQTALREVREETGLHIELERMTGVYYQDDHPAGEFIHFVFAAAIGQDAEVQTDSEEIADYRFFAADHLPEPMSASTRERVLDGLAPEPLALPVTLLPRAEW
jgi:8-oxo-dGTP pyrophosphatase MutT (NUDIX family)